MVIMILILAGVLLTAFLTAVFYHRKKAEENSGYKLVLNEIVVHTSEEIDR